MKKVLGVTLGVLTALGGFMDMGDIVANAATGARFGMALAWVVLLGVGGIVVYAEMAGRVATVSQRPVFDLVRERLGLRVGLVNLGASLFITVLTLVAEVAGVAPAFELATDVNYLLWAPLAALLVWGVIWRVEFDTMETAVGLTGLTLLVMVVAVWQLHPDWGALWESAARPTVPHGEGHATYWYYAIALFGAAMTPYEVFFFSSGAVEEHWGRRDLVLNRANVYLGFPLGGLLSLALMASTAVVFAPRDIEVETLSQAALPTALALGKVGLAFMIVGFSVRLNEVLGTRVVDAEGVDLGVVHDVGLVQDGPAGAGPEAAFRAHWLVVGSTSIWTRLGLDRRTTHGPALVKALACRGPRPWQVPWDAVESLGDDRITLRVPAAELERRADLPDE